MAVQHTHTHTCVRADGVCGGYGGDGGRGSMRCGLLLLLDKLQQFGPGCCTLPSQLLESVLHEPHRRVVHTSTLPKHNTHTGRVDTSAIEWMKPVIIRSFYLPIKM